jgi:platelet-activating factor acetylhydrolase
MFLCYHRSNLGQMVTGTTLESRIALREYIDTSVHFLEYLKSGEKKGILASDVTSSAGPLGDADKRGKTKGQFGAEWEVHVIPKSKSE